MEASSKADPDSNPVDAGRAQQRRRPRPPKWIPYLYLGFAAALVPWAAHLAVILPRRHVSEH